MTSIEQSPGNYTMPKIPEQYWKPEDYNSSSSSYNYDLGPKTVSDKYAQNKRLQIADYNAKLDISKREGSILAPKASVDEERNILGDLNTKAGVYYDEGNETYTVVGPKKYKDMSIHSIEETERPKIVKFADKSTLGRLKDTFFGYSLEERRRDVKSIEDIEKQRQLETTSIEPIPVREDPKIKERIISVASKWYQKPTAWLLGKGAEVVHAKKEEGVETKPSDILTYKKPEKKSILERQYESVKAEGEGITRLSNIFKTDVEDLEKSETYKENIESREQFSRLSKKYTDKGFAGTISDYGKFDKEGNILEIGPAMPTEDASKFLELSQRSKESYKVIGPEIEKLQTQEKELAAKGQTFEAKRKLFVESYEKAEKEKEEIQKRDPFKAHEMALFEGLKSEDISTPTKVAHGVRLGALMFGKTFVRDPIQTFITSPIDVYKEDVKEGRTSKTDLMKIPGAKYMSLVGRGIYDPYTESTKKFDPESLYGAITVGTLGYGAATGFAKAGVAGKATEVVKKGLKVGTVVRGGVLGLPPAIETGRYLITPPEERSVWESYGRVMKSYGVLGGFMAAGYVGGKVGAGIKMSQIKGYDIAKGLRSGEVKIQMYSTTKGKGFKNVRGVKNVNEVGRLSDKGNIFLDTPYGKYQIRTAGATENLGGKGVWKKTSERAPMYSDKMINLETKKRIWVMYNKEVGLHDKITKFDSFKKILSSPGKGRTIQRVKTFYGKHAPSIKNEILEKSKGWTQSGGMYGSGRIHMDIRMVDAMGRPIGDWKTFADVDSHTFDIFFKNPNEFRKIIDAKGHIEKYDAISRKGYTFSLHRDAKTGKYYFTPIRQDGTFVVKDITAPNVKKNLFYESKIQVGQSYKITKDHYLRLLKEQGDPTRLSNYLSRSQMAKTELFYKSGVGENVINFKNIQSVSILKSKPTNINADKFYYIGKTKDWKFLNKGLPEGTEVVKGSSLSGMTLAKNEVAFEISTGGVVKKSGTHWILSHKVGSHGIKSELGTPYKEFAGYSTTSIEGQGPTYLGKKGVAEEIGKYYGRPGTGHEVVDKSLRRAYLRKMIKGDLDSMGIKMTDVNIEKMIASKTFSIDPATGKLAVSAAQKAKLSTLYGGDWSNIKLSVGPKPSSVDAPIKVLRQYDPKLKKYVDVIGFLGPDKKTTIIGMGMGGTSTAPTHSLVFGSGVDSRLVGSYKAYTGMIPKTGSVEAAKHVISTTPGSTLAALQTGRISPVFKSIGGAGTWGGAGAGGVASALPTSIPLIISKIEEASKAGIEEKAIPGTLEIPKVGISTEIEPIAKEEVISETEPVEITEPVTRSITEPITEQTTDLAREPMENLVYSPTPTTFAPSPIGGIRTFIPKMVWPKLGFPIGSSKMKKKIGKYFGEASLDPMADWKIFFKRRFGYYGMPGTTKKVEIYKPGYKGHSDVGDIKGKIKEMTVIRGYDKNA